jgi:hypothetical protein
MPCGEKTHASPLESHQAVLFPVGPKAHACPLRRRTSRSPGSAVSAGVPACYRPRPRASGSSRQAPRCQPASPSLSAAHPPRLHPERLAPVITRRYVSVVLDVDVKRHKTAPTRFFNTSTSPVRQEMLCTRSTDKPVYMISALAWSKAQIHASACNQSTAMVCRG